MIPFLIPAARPNPSGIARFGRLVYWTTLVLTAMLLVFAWGAWTQPTVAPTLAIPYPNRGLPPETLIIFAAVIAMIAVCSGFATTCRCRRANRAPLDTLATFLD